MSKNLQIGQVIIFSHPTKDEIEVKVKIKEIHRKCYKIEVLSGQFYGLYIHENGPFVKSYFKKQEELHKKNMEVSKDEKDGYETPRNKDEELDKKFKNKEDFEKCLCPTGESQSHGKSWEIDIVKSLVTSPKKLEKYKQTAIYDCSKEDSITNRNVSIKTTKNIPVLCCSNIITDSISQLKLEEKENINAKVQFYKYSLKTAGENINRSKKNKALKDVVGKEYEEHRKRVWEYLGYQVDKKKNGAAFNVDWAIYFNEKLVALEEDKGHYVDSCFLERCLFSFIKTINNFNKKGEDIPKLILSSFTKYSKYTEKIEESFEITKEGICNILKEKLKYTYLNSNDRFPRDVWFNKNKENINNPYEIYQNDELIKEDIRFMLSLKE